MYQYRQCYLIPVHTPMYQYRQCYLILDHTPVYVPIQAVLPHICTHIFAPVQPMLTSVCLISTYSYAEPGSVAEQVWTYRLPVQKIRWRSNWYVLLPRLGIDITRIRHGLVNSIEILNWKSDHGAGSTMKLLWFCILSEVLEVDVHPDVALDIAKR